MADLTVDFIYRVANVAKVVDGDTMYLWVHKQATIDFGFGHVEKIDRGEQYIKIRLLGIDTWETRGEHAERGKLAREYAKHWFDEHIGGGLWVRTYKDDTGKYGRYLAEICTDDRFNEEDCLAYALREHGHEKVKD